MNAMAVPPPAWVPIGARETQWYARRNLRLGLLLSGLCHLSLLAALLFLVSRDREEPPVWSYERVTVVDRSVIQWEVQPPTSPPTRGPTADDGTVTPVPREMPIDPGDIPFTRAIVGVGSDSEGTKELPSAPAGSWTDALPEEGEFRPFDEEPAVLRRIVPAYPAWAREAGIAGTVLLHVLVDRDGRVARVSVIRDVRGLTDSAKEAVSKWQFKPAKSSGHPVAIWVEIPVTFRLD